MSDQKKIVIGVETSHSRGQICHFDGTQLIDNIFWDKKGSHSERLNSHFDDLQQSYKFSFEDIKALYCSIGPGSFTGLRVGINFCKTLSYVHNIPLYAVNTLHALSLLCDDSDLPVLSTIDAQKNSVFLSQFHKGEIVFENQLIGIKELPNHIKEPMNICGTGIKNYIDYINESFINSMTFNEEWELPDIRSFIDKNETTRFIEPINWAKLKPLYIRLSSAEEKKLGH
ncbi:MAG: tRNA (adenosine(37)-N6)-threonylcarbamoyltransferase complex dimerization subunit type 1 TsaB [Bdellovibrionales bacterium]|nr:tRNA (adenosine(37)-N6)-threonylcarbamoyltransferase complex dimerization subunit type 1 TsaB [Bdellovibrionales bacterium]NQZ19491.1 tRNA (adenosine(37)-N6)-threonylcarbamoyltransferase complex dimerization subunit type 1 TsaB [Bdellovibrionales bacterium]